MGRSHASSKLNLAVVGCCFAYGAFGAAPHAFAQDSDGDGIADNCELVQGDLNLDGLINSTDLAMLLAGWGAAQIPAEPECQMQVPPDWATVVEWDVDPAVVYDETLRAAITATGLPWRVTDTATQIEFLLIPPGTFSMGETGWAEPAHEVTLTQPFYMSRNEITQSQWQAAMGSNPSVFQGYSDSPNRPVEQVSWDAVQGYLSATGFRLPTEAEWEYAYRAGTATVFHGWPAMPNGTSSDSLVGTIAWHYSNSSSQTHAVGQKAANGFGLHDMAGNVWEWVQDWYGMYSTAPQTDPQGPTGGTDRILRSGGWSGIAFYCRASDRSNIVPTFANANTGFRAARTP